MLWLAYSCVVAVVLAAIGCENISRPESNPYFAEVVTPPARKEFRWSNGKLPKSFDPAMAAAPPETDVVRAIYEGLTATDPKTLDAVPAVAERWSSSDNGLTWTFQIRKDAVWSNGKPIKAADFVRSWNRLLALGDKEAHPELLRNFGRVKQEALARTEPRTSPTPWNSEEPPPLVPKPTPTPSPAPGQQKVDNEVLDLRAVGDNTLTVKLTVPDMDLPKLVANPVFSPIHGDGSEFAAQQPENAIISNGPFRLSLISKEGVSLDKSETYRGSDSVAIDTVRFVPAETPDEALEAYRTGKVDAVSNADFEPVALKLLAPYQDFRKVTHGAINLYEFNIKRAPFTDRDVREAMTVALERERLTDGEMEGSTRPALRYLPIGGGQVKEIVQDVGRAKELLSGAGFPDGKGFPVVRLVVNRNDAQLRIARAVAKMWKQDLGIDTEVIAKETSEMNAVRQSGDFDLIRRGIVFPSSDAVSNLSAIFAEPVPESTVQRSEFQLADANSARDEQRSETELDSKDRTPPMPHVPNEADALFELRAIPLYFPTSYLLVKPYVQGFDPNGLDVLSLKDIRIDNTWQPKTPSKES